MVGVSAGMAGMAVIVWFAAGARAHVDYVVSDPGTPADPVDLLVEVLSDPLHLALIAGGTLAAVGAGWAWRRWGHRVPDVRVLRSTLDDYERYVPWMLRLSVGLPLVGAGFAGFLYTPSLPTELRVPQVLAGFLLLVGLTTRVAAVAGLAGWLATFVVHPAEALLAGEYVGGFLAIALLGPGRPSGDHMVQSVAADPRTWYHRLDPVHRWAQRIGDRLDPFLEWVPVLVRVPLGATFLYLGLAEKMVHPGPALALADQLGLPELLPIGAGMWVLGAALVEIGVGLLLILGLFTRAAAASAFFVLTVTLLALPSDPVLPHVTLFGLASVVFTLGAGPLSLDALLGRPRSESARRSANS